MKHPLIVRLIPLSLLAILPLAPPVPAQNRASQNPPGSNQQDANQQASDVIKVDVDLVNVLCTVRNKSNGLVGNLEKRDFTVFEDGKQQEVKYFTRETDLPLTIGLLVDTSGSQERLIDIERRAAYEFFSKVLRQKDEAFLIQFGAEAELLQDATNSAKILQKGLDQLRLSV